jgi:hypothetical protein
MTLFTGFDGASKRPLDPTAAPLSPSTVQITWSDQSWDETGFVIERSPNGLAWSGLITLGPGVTSFNDATLAPGTQAFYRVRSANATANSAPTASASATTPTLFQNWAVSNGLDNSPGKESGFTDDPDFDSTPNGMEWILGSLPLSAFDSTPGVIANPGEYVFSFTRKDDSEASTTLNAQWTTGFVSWNSVSIGSVSSGPDANGVTVEVTENGSDPDAIVVRIPSSNAPQGRLFVRLRATVN